MNLISCGGHTKKKKKNEKLVKFLDKENFDIKKFKQFFDLFFPVCRGHVERDARTRNLSYNIYLMLFGAVQLRNQILKQFSSSPMPNIYLFFSPFDSRSRGLITVVAHITMYLCIWSGQANGIHF